MTKSAISNMNVTRLLIFLPVFIALVLTLSLVLIVANEQTDFANYHRGIARQAVGNLKHQLETFVAGKKRSVGIFARAESAMLARLYETPEDEILKTAIDSRLRSIFPDYSGFTVTRENGVRLIDSYREELGEACQSDIYRYLQTGSYDLFLHPGPVTPHFDIIVDWHHRERSGAFLVSFDPEAFAAMLANSQPSGHKLYVVNNREAGLIEVSGEGFRHNLIRDPFLTEWEKENAMARLEITGTNWTVTAIPDETLFSGNRSTVYSYAGWAVLVFFLAALLLTVLGLREASKRQRTVELLSEAKLRAEKANISKSRFLSNISHEFRTPLQAVIGYSDFLLGGDEVSQENRAKYATKIHEAGRHMLYMVDEIIKLSALDLDDHPAPLEVVHGERIIADVVRLMQQKARRNGIRIASTATGLPFFANGELLRHVLLHLVSNAIKYNRQGGQVTMAAEPLSAQTIRIKVTDNGRGIESKYQHLLFRPFERLAAHGSSLGGTGIGLAICKRLTEKMRGEIGFESVPGSGSSFWIDLPAVGGEISFSADSPEDLLENPIPQQA